MNQYKNTISLSRYISFTVKCLFLFIKTFILYSGLMVGGFELVFSASTTAVYILIYVLISFFSEKAAQKTTIIIYYISSVFMVIDAVYFSYVYHLPSVTQLGMAAQLTEVGDTVIGLIRPVHFLFIADLPFFILYSANRDIILSKLKGCTLEKKIKKLSAALISKKRAFGISASLAVLLILFIPFWPDFKTEYMSNEFFCYHISDFVNAAVNASVERDVDKTLYTSKDYSDSEYYGIAKNRNVIIIQVEALQNFMIGKTYNGQEITPNLNRLISNDSFYFDNYYYQIGGGNTADAEFSVNNSLFAPENEAAYIKYSENKYNGLPYLLKDNGYSGAHAFHNYIGTFWNREYAYPNQGFDSFTSIEDLEQNDMFALGLSDKEMFRQTIDDLQSFKEPFYAFYVTVSSHHPYGIPEKDRKITLLPEDNGTLFGLYLQAINYADRAIGEFIELLTAAGLYDNSAIVIYGDHYALSNTNTENSKRVSALTGESYSLFDVFNVPLIINIPGIDKRETIHTAGGHVDVLPTLLCLLGINNNKAVMFGQNLLEAEDGFVCEQAHVSIGSFISDEVFFKKPYNNIKSNYDSYLKETLERVDPDLYKEESNYAIKKILDCAALMSRDDILLD